MADIDRCNYCFPNVILKSILDECSSRIGWELSGQNCNDGQIRIKTIDTDTVRILKGHSYKGGLNYRIIYVDNSELFVPSFAEYTDCREPDPNCVPPPPSPQVPFTPVVPDVPDTPEVPNVPTTPTNCTHVVNNVIVDGCPAGQKCCHRFEVINGALQETFTCIDNADYCV